MIRCFVFQSTHPGWGATVMKVSSMSVLGVSIHAPRVGCDIAKPTDAPNHTVFQSTHPGWGATLHEESIKSSMMFQSTHPGWGATLSCCKSWLFTFCFNPRTPGGVRPSRSRVRIHWYSFNPRTPGGVRRSRIKRSSTSKGFNPRTPGGVRLLGTALVNRAIAVSIHAPRPGCDHQAKISKYCFRFQSTHPARGATEEKQ